ncbi:hypothetical protein MNV49_006933 [Pseudohyphozyma bogoriensis]|nr:hypothetical protein MNV49_006933 [Pseudohyphozyma bogoriensis]
MYHGIIGAITWLGIAPLAVLVARLLRNWPGWMGVHWKLQLLLTTPLTVTVVSLGFYAARIEGGTGFDSMDTHKITGFCLLAALIFQELIGLWIHLSGMQRSAEDKAKNGRWPRNYFHIAFGCAVIATGFTQVRLGMTDYGVSSTTYIYGYWM